MNIGLIHRHIQTGVASELARLGVERIEQDDSALTVTLIGQGRKVTADDVFDAIERWRAIDSAEMHEDRDF